MSQTVLFAPDLHKRDVDFSSIKGYMGAVEQVQKDILAFLQNLNADKKYFVSLGDWYDKGYRSTSRVFIDTYYDNEIAKAVDGNAYICIGNHFFLERDANPEMYLIQPSYLYQPRDVVPMEKPIFRTIPSLRIGNVQISFFHFNKDDKHYIQHVEPGVDFHIGLYHDDCVLPSDIRNLAGYMGSTSNDYLNAIYSNVDMAICGHIHTAIGVKNYTLNSGKSVPIVVPGALAITENKEIVKHHSVECPLLTVYDDGSFDIKYVEFSTHMDMLKFYKIKETKLEQSLEVMGTGTGDYNLPTAVSLKDFLRRKGYSENVVEIIMGITPGQTDVTTLWAMLQEVNTDGN